MKSWSRILVLFSALTLGLTGCEDSDKKDGDNKAQDDYVTWAGIPQQYHPTVDEVDFDINAVETLNINMFSFEKDVRLLYTANLTAGMGKIKIYKVWNEFASWGGLSTNVNSTTLSLSNTGQYQCEISVVNGAINALKGGCYVKIEVVLPVGSTIEVYNVGQLISKRFKPMTNEMFLENVEDAMNDESRYQAIQEYLTSYKETSTTPALSCLQLGQVIDEFISGDDKLNVLRFLHGYIVDRENLRQMIEDEFATFDQDDAFAIVGI